MYSFNISRLLPLLVLTLLTLHTHTYTYTSSYAQSTANSSSSSSSNSTSSSLPAIIVRGNKLYNSATNERFFINGVAYGYYVANEYKDKWLPALQAIHRDAPHINAIRFYTISSNSSYDMFMEETAKLGIYVIVPLTIESPAWCVLDRTGVPKPLYINSSEPSQPQCYPSCLLGEAQKIINQFNSYTNTLTYIIGNEVMNSRITYKAAPCVKQFTADIKSYFKQCNIRPVPLMYTAADNAIPETEDINRVDNRTGVLITAEENDRLKLNYLAGCGTVDQQIDIFGINTYRYCVSNRDFFQTNYNKLNDAFRGSPIPVILGEFGCSPFYYKNGTFNPSDVADTQNPGVQGQRDWKDVLWVYGTIDRSNITPIIDMGEVFDGGVAYEYGARGGHDFELYTGGSLDPAGVVGYSKACSPVGGCGIDNLENKLDQVMTYVNDPSRKQFYQPTQVDAATNTATNTTRTCPTSLWWDIDWSPIESRYTFGGYEKVQCPASASKAV